MRFSENSFSQGKRVGLGLLTLVMIYKNVLDGNHELWLSLALKRWILWKTEKRYELCETLGLMWIVLWNVYVYATTLICDLCVQLVEAFRFVWLVFLNNLENDRNDTNLVNFGICRHWPMKRICIHYWTHMWLVCIHGWGTWTCLLEFWWNDQKMLVFANIGEPCQNRTLWPDNLPLALYL